MSDIIYVDEDGRPIRGVRLLRMRAQDAARGAADQGRALLKVCLQNPEAAVAAAAFLASGVMEAAGVVRQLRRRRGR